MQTRTVVFGVSSGIAIHKILDCIRLLKETADCRVMMTDHATRMIEPRKFEEATGNRVYTTLFPAGFDATHVLAARQVDHIDLADGANLVVIAPATANIIAKLAHGIADDFVTTTTLAASCRVLVCPSMNVNMWNNPSVQENIATLVSRGFIVMDPETGPLACGYEGKGRLPAPERIVEEITTLLNASSRLAGKRVLVTYGGTKEAIDSVRFITNNSTGKMGAAIADACYLTGASVAVLRAEHAVLPRYVLAEQTFSTSQDLATLMRQAVPNVDIVFHVAAVSDFTVTTKQGKLASDATHTVELVPQPKIVGEIKKWNPNVFLVAFKAEYGVSGLIEKANKKLAGSGADMIVANDISQSDRGFAADTNEVYIFTKQTHQRKLRLGLKKEVALQIIEIVSTSLNR